MISIITTSYNYSEYISETIKSVLAQTYSDWELIVVDDCSSDNSLDVIQSFDDERIKVFKNEKNLGLKESIKKALAHAKGDWVAFLESDDTWSPETLQKRLEVAEKFPKVDIIFNDVELFGDENRISHMEIGLRDYYKELDKIEFPKNIYRNLELRNIIVTFSAFMTKREKFEDLNYNTPIDALFDWWLYIHLAKSGEAFYLNQKLTNWRMHKKSYIKKHAKGWFKSVNLVAYFDTMEKSEWTEWKNFVGFIFRYSVFKFFAFFRKLDNKRIFLINKLKKVKN